MAPPINPMITGPIPIGQMQAPPPMMMPPPRRFPDAPSPVGLGLALVGLLLLCVSLLIPRMTVQYDETDEYAYYNLTVYGGNGSVLGAETVMLGVALLAVVGLSVSRAPAWRWPTRITAIGLAAFGAAFAYHPIIALKEQLSAYEGFEGETFDAEVTADSGLYLMIFALGLLAASTFFMHVRMTRDTYQAPPQPPAPEPGQGPAPTVTVTPG